MKSVSLLVSCLLLGTVAYAAQTKPASPAAAKQSVATIAAGEYAGTWKATNESGGALRLKLKNESSTGWSGEASFTFDGANIPAKVTSIKVDGAKLELVFEWEIQGTPGKSRLSGEWKEGRLKGKYDSTPAEAAGEGTWELARA
ncbi:MAG: hypothetical protein HZC55_07110 [Verrucomicrobia bacterium]|nr:hypothetical protein [Verrucomicrobiota bacterium]